VTEAIPAAIKTETSLLLTLWASGDDFDNELTAFKSAITTYGSDLASLVEGISVGSEDLYRNSPTGIEADDGLGANPDTLVDYINQVRTAISGTAFSSIKVGHVDTWTAWVNASNDDVISNCDFIGVDAYPYFQNTMANSIDDAASLLESAIEETKANIGSLEVWITETGWPVSGSTENEGVASLANAKTYWDNVGCDLLFGKYNTWWYTLQDASPTTPSPSFGIVGSTLSTTPLFDLTCSNTTTSSSSSSSSTASATGSAGASSTLSTATTTASGSSSSGSSTGSSSSSSSSGAAGSNPAGGGSGSGTGSSSNSSSSAASSASAGASVSGSNSTVTTGSLSSSAAATASSSASGSSTSNVSTSGASAGMKSGVIGAGFLAMMVAVFAL
jgi:glucan endo-1,3-beta-D-glucosidase